MTKFMMRVGVIVLTLVAAMSFSGCIVVGHSSGGGWFVWPGGLGLLVVVLVVLFLLRGRR